MGGEDDIVHKQQRIVRIDRLLRLHADEPLDRVLRQHPRASEQELPLEQGAIERATSQPNYRADPGSDRTWR